MTVPVASVALAVLQVTCSASPAFGESLKTNNISILIRGFKATSQTSTRSASAVSSTASSDNSRATLETTEEPSESSSVETDRETVTEGEPVDKTSAGGPTEIGEWGVLYTNWYLLVNGVLVAALVVWVTWVVCGPVPEDPEPEPPVPVLPGIPIEMPRGPPGTSRFARKRILQQQNLPETANALELVKSQQEQDVQNPENPRTSKN